MQPHFFSLCLVLVLSNSLFAQDPDCTPAKVSFSDYKELIDEVEQHRADRLINLDTFLKMSKDPDTLILDARSETRFNRIHIQGAKGLAFTEFTRASLRAVIPSMGTRILIYCNNNFGGDYPDLAIKAAPIDDATANDSQKSKGSSAVRTLALNIPTYITLYGYGYRNVYELNEQLVIDDPRITFAGSRIPEKPLPLPELPDAPTKAARVSK